MVKWLAVSQLASQKTSLLLSFFLANGSKVKSRGFAVLPSFFTRFELL